VHASNSSNHVPTLIVKKYNSDEVILEIQHPFSEMKINHEVVADCGLITFHGQKYYSFFTVMKVVFNKKGLDELGVEVNLRLFRKFYRKYIVEQGINADDDLDLRYLSAEMAKKEVLA
jgi:rRNA maturation protein Rpf1